MDHVYNSLDLLNYGDDDPLRSALQQLSGEVYADLPSVEIAGAQTFLNALQQQMRQSRTGGPATAGGFAAAGPGEPGTTSAWVAGLGSFGRLSGDNDTHDVDFDVLGVAIGFDHRLDNDLAIGGALALSSSSLDTRKLSGDGDLTTVPRPLCQLFARRLVCRRRAGLRPWLGHGEPDDLLPRPRPLRRRRHGFEPVPVRRRNGYRLALGDSTDLTPFAAFQTIVVGQDEIKESRAGAVNLEIGGQTVTSA